MRRLLLVFCSLLFLIFSCETAANVRSGAGALFPVRRANTISLAAFFPAAPGRIWTYEGEGMEFAGFTRRVMFQQGNTFQVVDDNGGARVVRVFAVDSNSVGQIFSLAETDTEANFIDRPAKEKIILLKAPLAAGAVWQDDQYRRQVISTNETVAVPAGTFTNVIKVKITAIDSSKTDWHMFEYYAADTGLIMREFLGPDNYLVKAKLKSVSP